MPVKFNQLATSKILFNILLNLPCLLVGEIGFCMLIKPGVLASVLIIAFSIVYLLMRSGLGLIMNLRFPKLNWTNGAQASKQGLSLLITMFIDMLLCIVPMVLFFVLLQQLPNFNMTLFIGLSTIPVLIAAVVVYILLGSIGNKMYQKIY